MNEIVEIKVWKLRTLWMAVVTLVLALFVSLIAPRRPAAFSIFATATPTVAPTTRPTRTPIAEPTETLVPRPTVEVVACAADQVIGVDCPIDVDGLPVIVAAIEWPGEEFIDVYGQRWGPRDDLSATHEVLVVHIVLPPGTPPEAVAVWFEDGGSHAPQIEDGSGTVVATIGAAVPWEKNGVSILSLIFALPKGEGEFLRLQGQAVVALVDIPVVGLIRQPVTSPTTVPTRLVSPRE